MSDIKQKLLQIGNAQIHEDVFVDFSNLSSALKKDKGVELFVDESYISIYESADELRKLIADPTKVPSFVDITALQINKTIDEVIAQGQFQALLDTLNNLTRTDFTPPLSEPYTSAIRETGRQRTVRGNQFETYDQNTLNIIYTTPNYPNQDPRRTGRYVKPGPNNILKYPEIFKWLLRNSVNYGFLVYLDQGLYWVGVEELQAQLRNAVDTNNVRGRFLKNVQQLSLISSSSENNI
jgi:hypothetical protein